MLGMYVFIKVPLFCKTRAFLSQASNKLRKKNCKSLSLKYHQHIIIQNVNKNKITKPLVNHINMSTF